MPIRTFAKYAAIVRTQLANGLAYPLDLALRSVTMVLFAWVFAQLWSATYNALGETSIAGLTMPETLWYVICAEAIIMSKPRLSATIAESIKDGSVAYLLNKPYNFLLYHISVALGDALSRILFNALAGGAVVWLMVGPPPDLRGLPFVALAVLLGWTIDSCLTAMIGLTAFVTEDVAAFDWIYSKFVLVLGGVLLPLDLFPDWLRTITQALPFAYAVYGPARLFVSPEPGRFVALIAGQVAWIVVLFLVLALLYRRGLARLSINGG